MYISCFFVFISFAFGSQRKPSFQWNMGFKSSDLVSEGHMLVFLYAPPPRDRTRLRPRFGSGTSVPIRGSWYTGTTGKMGCVTGVIELGHLREDLVFQVSYREGRTGWVGVFLPCYQVYTYAGVTFGYESGSSRRPDR